VPDLVSPTGVTPTPIDPLNWCVRAFRWLLFEHVAVVQDRYPLLQDLAREPWLEATRAAAGPAAGPLVQNAFKTGFSTPKAAARLRSAAAARHGWPLEAARGGRRRRGGGGGGCKAGGSGGDGGACGDGGAAERDDGGEQQAGGGDAEHWEAGGQLPAPPRVVTVMLDPDHYPPITNFQALVERLEDVTAPLGFKVGSVQGREIDVLGFLDMCKSNWDVEITCLYRCVRTFFCFCGCASARVRECARLCVSACAPVRRCCAFEASAQLRPSP
jgi:hypothetical protein